MSDTAQAYTTGCSPRKTASSSLWLTAQEPQPLCQVGMKKPHISRYSANIYQTGFIVSADNY